MAYDQSTVIKDFLDAAAARQPTPGGGSVAALVGALAASMGEMVVNYSIGKKSLAAFEGELKPAVAEFNRARQMLVQLMVEDQLAYQSYSEATKLKEGTPERQATLGPALLASIRVPQALAGTAIAVLEICDQVINFVNPHLLSDLAVCADLAMATTRCAVYNVRVNVKNVTDPEERRRIESDISQLLSRASLLIQRVAPRIWEREGQEA